MAHGNFTPEEAPTTESPIQSDVFVEKNGAAEGELPVSTAKHDDPTYMAVVIGVLTAVILLLAVAIFLIVSRHRQRKCFASPMTGKAPSHLGSTCATVEKGAALMAYTLEDDERYSMNEDYSIEGKSKWTANRNRYQRSFVSTACLRINTNIDFNYLAHNMCTIRMKMNCTVLVLVRLNFSDLPLSIYFYLRLY